MRHLTGDEVEKHTHPSENVSGIITHVDAIVIGPGLPQVGDLLVGVCPAGFGLVPGSGQLPLLGDSRVDA